MDPQQTRVRIVRFTVILLAGMCLGSVMNASLSWANNGVDPQKLISQVKQLSPEEFAEILRKAQPRATEAQTDCEEELAEVNYWEAIVDAAEEALMDAYAAFDECDQGGPDPN